MKLQFLSYMLFCIFSEGGTPLHWAAGEGKIDAVEALVELGAEVNCTLK